MTFITRLMAFLASSFGVSNGAGSETAHIYEGLENATNLLALSLTNSPVILSVASTLKTLG